MAKKKASAVGENESQADALVRQMEEKYGKGIVRSGSEVSEEKRHVISVSPSVDLGLGGGIPEGSWLSICGPEKIGKSMTCLTFCAECQKEENGSRPIFYFDVECRLKSRDINGVKGLDPSKDFHVIRSTEDKIFSTVDYLIMAGDILKGVKKAVIVFDSISAMCNPTILEDNVGKSDYGANNKLISQFCDINCAVVPINKSIVIGVIHQYANTSGYGPAAREKAAGRWKYQADVNIIAKGAAPWRTGSDDKSPQIGQIITWIIKTSAIGVPGAKIESYLRYNIGIDKTYELLTMAKDLGLLTAAGSWMTLDFVTEDMAVGTEFEGKPVKMQGLEKAYNLLEEKPEWASYLNNKIKEALA